MFLITIGAIQNSNKIMENLCAELEKIKENQGYFMYEHYTLGDTNFCKCYVKENIITRFADKKQFEELRFNIAKILTDLIINHWEKRLLKKILKENFFYLNEKEKESVLVIANRLLQEEKPILPGGFYRLTRQNKVLRCVYDYLSSNEDFNIDGFVNFRLGIYIKELNETLERAIEMYVAEREYNEFIRLLKYFVDIQECKLDTIHLRQLPNGEYLLLDENYKSINGEYFDDIRSDLNCENINYDDLLISTLITISPRRVYIHDMDNFKNKELVKTITNVFTERIVTCTGCELCKSNLSSKETIETNKYGL